MSFSLPSRKAWSQSRYNIIDICVRTCGVYKRGTIDVPVGRSRELAVAAYVNLNSSSFVYTYLATQRYIIDSFYLWGKIHAAVLSQNTFTGKYEVL